MGREIAFDLPDSGKSCEPNPTFQDLMLEALGVECLRSHEERLRIRAELPRLWVSGEVEYPLVFDEFRRRCGCTPWKDAEPPAKTRSSTS